MKIKRVDREQFTNRKPYSRFVLFGGNICFVVYHYLSNEHGVEAVVELNNGNDYTEGYGVACLMNDVGVTSALYAALYDIGVYITCRKDTLAEALKMIANAFLMSNYSIEGGVL